MEAFYILVMDSGYLKTIFLIRELFFAGRHVFKSFATKNYMQITLNKIRFSEKIFLKQSQFKADVFTI